MLLFIQTRIMALMQYSTSSKIGCESLLFVQIFEISNKVNSYSTSTIVWETFSKKYDFIDAATIVCTTMLDL